MYSDKKNILQLVALLKAHGVRKIEIGRASCRERVLLLV